MATLLAATLASSVTLGLSEEAVSLDCELRATAGNGLVRLEAVAVSNAAAVGSYRLLIEKTGAGGTTRNVQSGAFKVGADEKRVLSTSSISIGPSDWYAAELTVEWDGHQRRCTAGSKTKI